jgi:hypothetical protein
MYEWLMGVLMLEVGGGALCLPIIAHVIANYALFSSVARGNAMKASS